MHQDHAAVCQNLDARPPLWRILCLNAHPAYTFDVSDAPKLPDVFAAGLRERVANDIVTRAPIGKAYCYSKAAWDCRFDLMHQFRLDAPGLT